MIDSPGSLPTSLHSIVAYTSPAHGAAAGAAGGYGPFTTFQLGGPVAENTVAGANAVCAGTLPSGLESITTFPAGAPMATLDWWPNPVQPWQPERWPFGPVDPLPLIPNPGINIFTTPLCTHQHFCVYCWAAAIEAMKALGVTMTTPATPASPTDMLVKNAEARLKELDTKLAEVPALQAERERLAKMLKAAK